MYFFCIAHALESSQAVQPRLEFKLRSREDTLTGKALSLRQCGDCETRVISRILNDVT